MSTPYDDEEIAEWTDSQFEEFLADYDLSIDFGNLIDSPFISDGRVRIFPLDEPYSMIAEGDSAVEALRGVSYEYLRG